MNFPMKYEFDLIHVPVCILNITERQYTFLFKGNLRDKNPSNHLVWMMIRSDQNYICQDVRTHELGRETFWLWYHVKH